MVTLNGLYSLAFSNFILLYGSMEFHDPLDGAHTQGQWKPCSEATARRWTLEELELNS